MGVISEHGEEDGTGGILLQHQIKEKSDYIPKLLLNFHSFWYDKLLLKIYILICFKFAPEHRQLGVLYWYIISIMHR